MEFSLDLSRIQIPEVVLMLIAGVIILFFGYRIKKIAFFIAWFVIGLNLTSFLMPQINGFVPQIRDMEIWQNLLPIAGGLLMALLGFTIEKLCIGGIVFSLVMLITVQNFGTAMQTMVIGAVIGIILAGIAVMLVKPAIILATSLAGAYAITLSLLTIFTSIDAGTYYFPMLIGLSAIGAVTQFTTTKHR